LALDGAQTLYVVGNSPGRGVRGERLDTERAYDALCRSAALCYGIYVVFVNRVGFEDGVNFWGGSRVVDPYGEQVAAASLWDEELLHVTLDSEEIRRARTRTPLLANERLDVTLHHLHRIQNEWLDDQS